MSNPWDDPWYIKLGDRIAIFFAVLTMGSLFVVFIAFLLKVAGFI